MQGFETGAIGVDGENCAEPRTAAVVRRPIQNVTRQDQTVVWVSSVCVGSGIGSSCRETIQGRKGLRRHLTSQHRAKSGYKHGRETQFSNAGSHGSLLLITGLQLANPSGHTADITIAWNDGALT